MSPQPQRATHRTPSIITLPSIRSNPTHCSLSFSLTCEVASNSITSNCDSYNTFYKAKSLTREYISNTYYYTHAKILRWVYNMQWAQKLLIYHKRGHIRYAQTHTCHVYISQSVLSWWRGGHMRAEQRLQKAVPGQVLRSDTHTHSKVTRTESCLLPPGPGWELENCKLKPTLRDAEVCVS